jgi:hypothetical protein
MLIELYVFAFYAYKLIFIFNNCSNKYFVLFIMVVRYCFSSLISIVLKSLHCLITSHFLHRFNHYLKAVLISKELMNLLIMYIVHGLYLETLTNCYPY